MRPNVEKALARLRDRDDALAQRAELAEGELLAGQDVTVLDQAGVQYALWWSVPKRYPPELWVDIADGAAALLDELGFDRYAEIARSQVTAEIHAAFRGGRSASYKRYQKALRDSGIDPPDTPLLAWGSIQGTYESSGRSTVARALEAAITNGQMVVGASGWKATAEAVTTDALTTPVPDLLGQSWLAMVISERVETWVCAPRVEAHGRWRAAVANHLLAPIAPPSDADDITSPLRWLLEKTLDGIDLTASGYLARTIVVDAAERFGWWDWEKPPRSEADLLQLGMLRKAATSQGVLRRRGRTVKTTSKGEQLLGDPEALWRAVAASLGGQDDFNHMLAELVGLRLLQGRVVSDELDDAIVPILLVQGWRRKDRSLTDRELGFSIHEPLFYWRALGLLDEQKPRWEGGSEIGQYSKALTDGGRATVLEYLRARATGPRQQFGE